MVTLHELTSISNQWTESVGVGKMTIPITVNSLGVVLSLLGVIQKLSSIYVKRYSQAVIDYGIIGVVQLERLTRSQSVTSLLCLHPQITLQVMAIISRLL